ncbi:MAG TPA: lysine--tRNA ligase, partial [Bacteroidetes bacterium]|nr:lysine--tRNA ligase [Bacteroidota bacterium]
MDSSSNQPKESSQSPSQEGSSQQELRAIRIDKVSQLREHGVNPYPTSFDVTHHTQAIHEAGDSMIAEPVEEGQRVRIAGRVMTRRIMGKAAFFNLQDATGVLQVYIRRDDLPEGQFNEVFKKLTDIGDIVGIEGFVFRTKMGELTVHALHFEMLSKAVRTIPIAKEVEQEDGQKVVYDAFSDKE